jgi:nucleotide-binding universal stress UspA family protein
MGRKKPRILIAVDGSDPSLEAVRYVARLFQPEQARFTLFHVLDPVPEAVRDLQGRAESGDERFNRGQWKSFQKKGAKEFLDLCFLQLGKDGHRKESVTTLVQERKVGVARDIIAEARKGYDALVMGRRGLSPVKGLLFGSITNKVVGRLGDVSIWVVGKAPPRKKLLVAVDSSEESRRILEYVERLFDPAAGHPEIMLLHVIRERKGLLPDYDVLNPLDRREDWLKRAIGEFDRVREEMNALFAETLGRWEKRGFDRVRISGRISHGESRAATIVRQAQRGGFDTVVVGRRGLTRVEEFLMGRVSNKVLQLAGDLAVWVVH